MLGKNFVDVLMRQDEKSFKIGHSTKLKRRVQDLNRNFGPFSSEHSYAIRTRSGIQARKLEDSLRTLLGSYRFTLPIGTRHNGQSEWFTGPSLTVLADHLHSILSMDLRKFQTQATLESGNSNFHAWTNFCSSTEENHLFQRISLNFDRARSIHDQSWESADFVSEIYSIMEDLIQECPLPDEYRQHVGVHFFDRLPEQQRRDITRALMSFFIGL